MHDQLDAIEARLDMLEGVLIEAVSMSLARLASEDEETANVISKRADQMAAWVRASGGVAFLAKPRDRKMAVIDDETMQITREERES